MFADNKTLVRRYFEEAFGQGHLAVLDEIMAPHWVDHTTGTPPGLEKGSAGARQLISIYRKGFPDISFHIEDQIAEGDKVVTRWSSSGTQAGELLGMAATGKKATVTGISIDRCVGGKLVESWGVFDQLGMLQQLGLAPTPGR
jgi:predicted ester cyclase